MLASFSSWGLACRWIWSSLTWALILAFRRPAIPSLRLATEISISLRLTSMVPRMLSIFAWIFSLATSIRAPHP